MFNTRQRGVSLIELAIGLAVMGVLIALALPSFRTWMQNSQIRTASETLLAGVQLARGEAVKRNTQVTLTLNGNDWTITSGGVTLQSRSNSEGTRNAVITPDPAGTTAVTFNGLGQNVAANTIQLNVTNPTGGACQGSGGVMRCLRVVIQPAGQVRLCDPQRPATDPQGC